MKKGLLAASVIGTVAGGTVLLRWGDTDTVSLFSCGRRNIGRYAKRVLCDAIRHVCAMCISSMHLQHVCRHCRLRPVCSLSLCVAPLGRRWPPRPSVCLSVARDAGTAPTFSTEACLEGRTVLVTGANRGLGRETALDCARRGARVHLACRDMVKCEEVRRTRGEGRVRRYAAHPGGEGGGAGGTPHTRGLRGGGAGGTPHPGEQEDAAQGLRRCRQTQWTVEWWPMSS